MSQLSLQEIIDEVNEVKRYFYASLENIDGIESLKELEIAVLSKKGSVAFLNRQLGSLDQDLRQSAGAVINQARSEMKGDFDEAFRKLVAKTRDTQLEHEKLDLSEIITDSGFRAGRKHLITRTREELEDIFIGMGFTVEEGPEVETDWHNFEALNIPPYHPARAGQDSFYLKFGDPESMLLRTHTSPVQIRVMTSQQPPIYAVMPGRVYRRDTADARHTPVFHQIEGLVVDKDISFANLAGTIETFTKAIFGPSIVSRLRPAFFPFTEPSAEFEVTCTICEGVGCRTCSNTGWIELGGCGMIDPKVFASVGLDSEVWSGFAFGFGIDRLAQMRYAISDMRILLDNDVRFLRQF
ncbi:MAG: phenylalanine--tRNA ligase subunit alpha [Acidimicrobiaceae bacterium]|nr:phenylalanine--tRNA ligase subunit alpha [Acidimicrobiaceae bacterium]